MTHTEASDYLTFWDDWEDVAITEWLTARGYKPDGPTVCGSCCGIFSQEYWLQWKPGDRKKFKAFAIKKSIEAVPHANGIQIGNPKGEA